MCIKKKIAELQEQIDAKLKLKALLEKTQPLLTSISVICSDYREVAPEELSFLMDEIMQAAQIDLSVAAISAIASTGDERTQDFAVDAITQAIEQRASATFREKSVSEIEYEPDECTDSVSNILNSRGFYEPDVNLADVYDPEDKQGSYQGWDIYCSVHDSGQAMSIGLSNEQLEQFWDVCTEFLSDHDSSFPKSLSKKQPILAWVRSVIDLFPEPMIAKEDLETPGQLSLQFADGVLTGKEYDAAVEEELDDDDIPELGGNWAEDITNATEVVPPQELTKLQKLLEGTNNYIFEKLGARVRINSEFIENNHGEEPETIEEALFTVTDLDGKKIQYYYHSAEDLTDRKPIAGWNPLGNLMDTAESYAKKWAKEQIEKFLITNLPLHQAEMRARVTPVIADGNKFAGATFTFYSNGGTEELFSTSQTAEEIARGENNPRLIAVALAENWLKRQKLKNSSPAGTTHTEPRPKDDFTELVYVSAHVAYLKRKDTAEILSGYLGFSNKTPSGDRAPTMAKSRATKWQEHLVGVYQLACSGPRECQRIESKNPKMPFKYELKLVKPSMGQLQGLSTEDFSLYPNEVEEKNERFVARGEIPPQEIELADFQFLQVADFDSLNPEFRVEYEGEELTNVWNVLRTIPGQQAQRLWRHKLLKPGEEIELKNREAAAFHALQRTRGLT